MVTAWLRLALTTISIVIVCIFAVVSLRWMGSQQGFSAPPHPWFQRDFWWIYNPTAADLCGGRNLDSFLPKKDWIVVLPIHRKEDLWFVSCPKPLDLGDYLKNAAHQDFLLNIQSHDTWALDKLVQIIAPYDESKRFAATSESQKVLLYLRKNAPQWAYAADSSSLLRLKMFESLWIESVMDFWPDFMVTSFSPQEAFHLDPRMATELERRKKRIIWNWDGNASEKPQVHIQGIMTNRPSAAQQKFGDGLF
jgi:hypothetical protein